MQLSYSEIALMQRDGRHGKGVAPRRPSSGRFAMLYEVASVFAFRWQRRVVEGIVVSGVRMDARYLVAFVRSSRVFEHRD